VVVLHTAGLWLIVGLGNPGAQYERTRWVQALSGGCLGTVDLKFQHIADCVVCSGAGSTGTRGPLMCRRQDTAFDRVAHGALRCGHSMHADWLSKAFLMLSSLALPMTAQLSGRFAPLQA
jgi:hypothetical protein